MKNFLSFQSACLSACKHLLGIASIALIAFCFGNSARAQQTIYVTDYNLDGPNGVDGGDIEYVPVTGGTATPLAPVRAPTGLVYDPNTGFLYVSSSKPDPTNGILPKILKVQLTGGTPTNFYDDTGLSLGQPHGLHFDGNGKLYVATGPIGDTVLAFKPPFGDNNLPKLFKMDSRFEAPADINVDSHNSLFVSDPMAGMVFKFTTTGGSQAISFDGAYGLAFDSTGNLYVSSVTNNKVEKFAPSGTDMGVFTQGGTLSAPKGIAFDSAWNLYVANGDHSIDQYDSNGIWQGTIASTQKFNPHFLVIH